MLKKILNKFNHLFFSFNPKIKSKNKKVQHVGTIYGGYDVFEDSLDKPIILSCGLGEDASFDIEMIDKYDAKVFCIDPTPRAKEHYYKIKSRFGKKAEEEYNESGYLKPETYNLENVNDTNLIFIDKAIWSENDKDLKLYYPKNKNFVSLSINKKSEYDQTEFHLSKTVTFAEIIRQNDLNCVDILKLDIEGAEIDVIYNFLNNPKFLPNQLIVEFDIRRRPSINSYVKLNKINKRIEKYYELININLKGDFTYLRNV